jgi:hypothetical protein
MLELLLEIDLRFGVEPHHRRSADVVPCAEYVVAYSYMLADALEVDALDVWGHRELEVRRAR